MCIAVAEQNKRRKISAQTVERGPQRNEEKKDENKSYDDDDKQQNKKVPRSKVR